MITAARARGQRPEARSQSPSALFALWPFWILPRRKPQLSTNHSFYSVTNT